MKTSDSLTLAMLSLQNTPQGVEYCELNRSEPGSLSATKNHQGGLADAEDESSAQIFCVSGSEKCLVKTLKNYLRHLSPTSDALFQRPRDGQRKTFNPTDDKIWFCNASVGTEQVQSYISQTTASIYICHSALPP